MCGEDVFAWFDRELVRHEYQRPLMPHQKDLTDAGLTYHFQFWAAEMGTGKTLSAQELIERSGVQDWFWIGPKTSPAEHQAGIPHLEVPRRASSTFSITPTKVWCV